MRFDFEKLEQLRLLAAKFLDDHVASLEHFAHDGGYGHVDNKKRSVSSTATCVISLTTRKLWPQDKAKTKELIRYLLSKKKSAGLPNNNPFTLSWVLNAVTALEPFSDPLEKDDLKRINEIVSTLQRRIISGKGGVVMKPYPPSGYLTQLVIRSLDERNALPKNLAARSRAWAWAELPKQLSLIQAQSKAQDAFALAYLLMVVTRLTPESEITPEELSIQKIALQIFFACQLQDGTWPLSRPLFHYPKFGNAYCYEFEMLTQLLGEPGLRDLLLDHLQELSKSVANVANSGYHLSATVRAWSSGHHPQLGRPESWATASVYHFFYNLDRLLAEAVRRELFHYLELPPPRFGDPLKDEKDFAPLVIDSEVTMRDGNKHSLKTVLWERFVSPMSLKAPEIKGGSRFKGGDPRSSIFFGPPGTSKTEMSKEIATFLGWPFLAIDPSMLLRKGMDSIQVEANAIFRILEQTEGVVVLFDEFDELVRDRESESSEQPSRLLTTAMLPKLASIHKRGKLVFIIATNFISRFDLAIRRPGRFDLVLQIMPPTFTSKMQKKDWGASKNVDIRAILDTHGLVDDAAIQKHLGELTFGECDSLASELPGVTNQRDVISRIESAFKNCTLETHVEKDVTWLKRCEDEATKFNS
jgi:hypothetical protein